MAGNGGKRIGAGRPKGTIGIVRKKIHDFFTQKDIQELVETAKKQALEKPELLKFLLEQLFGKAPQAVEVSGKDGGKIIVGIQYVQPNAGDNSDNQTDHQAT